MNSQFEQCIVSNDAMNRTALDRKVNESSTGSHKLPNGRMPRSSNTGENTVQQTLVQVDRAERMRGNGFSGALRALVQKPWCIGLAALLALPLPALAANLQVSQLSDSNSGWLESDGTLRGVGSSDPAPVGAVLVYDVTLGNIDVAASGPATAIFDLPAGATFRADLGDALSGCTQAGNRVTCPIPAGIPANGNLSFKLKVDTEGLAAGSMRIYGAIGEGPAPAGSISSLTTESGVLITDVANDPFFTGDANRTNNVLFQGTTLTSAADLSLVKSATPAFPTAVVGGSIVTYRIAVTNLGPAAATNFNVVDSLPGNFTFVAGSFTSSAGWTFNAGSMTATHSGSLANGGNAWFEFKAKANVATGTVTNNATVNSVGSVDPRPGNNNGSANTTLIEGADLSLELSAAPIPATVDGTVTFTLAARNHGPSDAQNVTITGTLPAGFTITGTPGLPPSWDCSASANTTISCSRSGSFANGANESIQITSTASSTPGSVTANAQIGSNTADPDHTNNPASVKFDVLADGADLWLRKSKEARQLGPDGKPVTVVPVGTTAASEMLSTLRLTNLGPARITGRAQIVDVLADGEEYMGVESGPFTCTAVPAAYTPGTRQVVTCNYTGIYPVPVSPNAETPFATLVMVTRARAADPVTGRLLTNHACTGGSTPSGGIASLEPLTEGGVDSDKITTNDCAGAGLRATTTASDLSIEKLTSAPVGKIVGVTATSMTYTLTVKNAAGATATAGVVVNDALPGWVNGLTVADVTPPAGWPANACSVSSGGSLVCNSGASLLAPGGSAVVVVNLRNAGNTPGFLMDSVGGPATNQCAADGNAPASGHFHCNRAGVGVDGTQTGAVGESDWSNNYDTDWVRVERVANLQTQSKTITSGTGQAGVDAVYRIEYTNEGPSTVPNVRFTDTFTLLAKDEGFVLISAQLAGGGACTVTAMDAGISQSAAAGGPRYRNSANVPQDLTLTCPQVATMSRGDVQTVNLTIRPEVNLGNSGRVFNNTAGFEIVGGATGTDPTNGDWNYNRVATDADDTKSATLNFTAGKVDLLVQKNDTFTGYTYDPFPFDPSNLAGNVFAYKITATNQGPSVAQDVRILDSLVPPDGKTVTYLGAAETPAGVPDPARCTASAGTSVTGNSAGTNKLVLDCQMPGSGFTGSDQAGVLAAGASSDLYISYRYDTAPAAGSDVVRNSVLVHSEETRVGADLTADDGNAANNSTADTTTIFMRTDMGVTKMAVASLPAADPAVALPAAAASVTVKQPFWYVVTATNHGPGPSLSRDRTGTSPVSGTGTIVTDTLPTGLTVTGPITWQKIGPAFADDPTSQPNGSGNCTLAGQVVTCETGDVTNTGLVRVIVPAVWNNLPPGSTAPLGTASNQARVSSEQIDSNTTNNQTTEPLDVVNVSLSGRVFVDSNRTGTNGGVWQTGEATLDLVEIRLTGTDAYGNTVNETAYTDTNGQYSFANLAPSGSAGYTITQVQPTGYANGPVAPPTAGANAATFNPGSYQAGTPDSSYVVVVSPSTPLSTGGTIGEHGAQGVRYDFPEVTGVSLSGYVYADVARDDAYGVGDAAIDGASVELLVLDSGNYVSTGRTATTNASGYYEFLSLDPFKTYALRQPLPTGYLNLPSAINPGLVNGVSCGAGCTTATGAAGDPATTDRIVGIDLSTGNGTNFNFGETVPVSVSGSVFFDIGNDGTQNNAADVGIGGVDIVLSGTDDLGAPVSLTVQTGADGSFSFTGLRPGTYTLTEPTQPTGTINGITTAGTVKGIHSGTATAVAVTPSAITTINLLVPGSASIDNLFAEIPTNSSIVGRVWLDDNDNGVIDAGESGIGGVTVELTGTDLAGNPVTRSTTTGTNGDYSFTNLPPGTYSVIEPTQPPHTLNGQTVAGTINGVAMPGATVTGKAITPSEIGNIVLGVNEHSVQNNFGEIAMNGSIAGRVWLDRNNDGVIDGDEVGIAGVTVRLTGTDSLGNTVDVEIQTDAQGNYLFDGLAPGTYTVTEPTQPTGTLNGKTVPGSHGGSGTSPSTVPSAISGIVLGPNGQSVNNNFGEIPPASISGQVWYDDNDNGKVDAGETGIPGQEVVLEGTDDLGNPVRVTTTTDGDGKYEFPNLRPGRYKVIQPNQPSQTENGQTVPGSTGGTGTPKSEPVSVIDELVLESGTHSKTNNFGEINNDLPDLRVSKSLTPETLFTGATASYSIVVRNAGLSETRGEYEVIDRLPAGVTLADVPTGDGWTCSGAVGEVRFSCRSSTVLAAGQTSAALISVPVKVAADAIAETVNNAVLVSGGGEPGSRGPTPEEKKALEDGDVGTLPVCEADVVHNACRLPSELVKAWPDLVVSKAADTEVFTVGQQANYEIRVRNIGERATDAEYVVTDHLPAGLVLAGVPTGDGWTCTGAVGENRFLCASSRELAVDTIHPGTIKVPVEVLPEALEQGTVNNAVIVAGGGEDPERKPTDEQWKQFEETPGELELCDPQISQNLCRVPNEVQASLEDTQLVISKRGDRATAEIGDIVQYSIEVRHVAGSPLRTVNIVDTLPRGFTYIDGTARVGGRALEEPFGRPGPRLGFNLGPINVGQQLVLTYRVRVGVGAQQGDGINRAQAHGCSIAGGCIDPVSLTPVPGAVPSNRAEYRVRVTGGVFTEEACVLGKVFVDCNNNHVQDEEELGIPGVRLYFSNGTWVISDSEGKYSYCGLTPQSHTLKVDPSTLPAGSRLTTSSNRNLGDADSLFLDLKNGELHRADFVEGSCSNPLLEQVKARRTQGEVRAPETETGQSQLRFDSKPVRAPQQATDSANQRPIVHPRPNPPSAPASQEVQP